MVNNFRLIVGKVFKKFSALILGDNYEIDLFLQNAVKEGYTVSFGAQFTTFVKESVSLKLRNTGSDFDVFNQMLISKEYKAAVEMLHDNANEINTVLDLGANIGLASVYFSEQFPQATIIAVEPDVNNFKMLEINAKNSSRIKTLQKAIWHDNRNVKVVSDFRDGKDWSKRVSETSESGAELNVQTTTITEILNSEHIEVLDFLKIDIEGAEKEILNRNVNVDFLDRVRVLCIEIHDEIVDRAEIYNVLKEKGFMLFNGTETTIAINLAKVKHL